MKEIAPRFEFRAFAQNFGITEEKIAKLSEVNRFRESREIYILSAGNDKNNIKIRYNMIDIKFLVKEQKGLQLWAPRMKEKFPIRAETIRDAVFPALKADVPVLKRTDYTQKQYLGEIIEPHPELVVAHVSKRRFGYMIDDCIAEIAELLINSAAVKTIAIESIDMDAVLKAKETLGLQKYENVNYVLAIKRILGMAPLTESI